MTDLFVPAGSTATDDYATVISAERAGWGYSSLRTLELGAGQQFRLETGPDEILVLPLRGACTVSSRGTVLELRGRRDVFAGPTDFAYLPPGRSVEIASGLGGRFALPGARARAGLPFRYGPADGVPVELRGAGSSSRQVHNFCTPEAFAADRLIACEVLTPGGNWSSYPPHKHDEARPGECVLEEIYYFEVAPGPRGEGIAYQRVYGDPERPLDLLAEVRTGDVVLVPHGWHGPSMAPPGYDLYYLNVMAGPGPERAWRICDDPAHAWVRDTWAGQPIDARLPFGAGQEARSIAGDPP